MKFKCIITLIAMLNITLGYSQQTVGLFINDSIAINGYTLVAPYNGLQTYLLDNCGLLVHEWTNSVHNPGASVYLLEDGSLMRTCRIPGALGGRIEHYSWDDDLLWSYNVADSTQHQHHDIEILPNGNILALVFDFKTDVEAIAAGKDPSMVQNECWSQKIIELEPVGIDSAIIVWEWYLWDHLVQDLNMNQNYGEISQHPELIDINYVGTNDSGPDWVHANSIDYNSNLDQIVISSRTYNEIWVIDHSTTTAEAASHIGGNLGKGGDIVYRWGNPATYQLALPEDRTFRGQHDAHWIPAGLKDGGKIMVYNNGSGDISVASKVQIIDPPVDSNGNYFYEMNTSYLPDTVSWSYTTPFSSNFISGAQRLENGHTFICDGPLGNIIEIDTLENIVWQYINPIGLSGITTDQGNIPDNNYLFRANKFSPSYPAFLGRDLTPSTPIELNPLPSNCVIYSPINTEQEWQTLDINVTQNPIPDLLKIQNLTHQNIQLKVVDILGREIIEDNTNQSVIEYNVSNWTKGIYFIIAISENKKAFYQQQIIKL